MTYLDGIRCYRSGDVCIYQEDGSLFYLGRKDNEVKFGGYRVHPNEVRRVINSVPNVHDSEAVLVRPSIRKKSWLQESFSMRGAKRGRTTSTSRSFGFVLVL